MGGGAAGGLSGGCVGGGADGIGADGEGMPGEGDSDGGSVGNGGETGGGGADGGEPGKQHGASTKQMTSDDDSPLHQSPGKPVYHLLRLCWLVWILSLHHEAG